MVYLPPEKMDKLHNSPDAQPTEDVQPTDDVLLLEQKFLLSQREAEAATPTDMAVCGEEDPGEGAEFLVDENIRR